MTNSKLELRLRVRAGALCLPLLAGAFGGSAALLTAVPGYAQSAADKATARQLATAGIKLFQQGNFEEALDKLKRAQALYDAPVHLLYMARCQVNLGKLVEGAESYRKLVRTELEAKAPQVFKDAIAEGEEELAQVEPRLSGLTIVVEPAGAEGLEILLDGEPVSAAVLGVERPANPGERKVVARAPGYLPAEASTTLAEGEQQQLSLTLQVDPNAKREEEERKAAEAAAQRRQEQLSPQAGTSDLASIADDELVSLFAGARGGGVLPSGSLEDDASMSDYIGPGGGLEIHAGLRLFRNFGIKAFYERYWMNAGSELDTAPEGLLMSDQYEVTSNARISSFGVSVIGGTQRGQIGGYGELGLAISHVYGWDRDILDNSTGGQNFDPCVEVIEYSGPAVRVGGAFVFPVHPNLQLTASALVTLGAFSNRKFESNCAFHPINIQNPLPGEEYMAPAFRQDLHTQVFFGLGADFTLGIQ